MVRHTRSRGSRHNTSAQRRRRPLARPTLLALAAATATAAALYAPPAARAADGTWTGTAAGTYNYSDTAQWLNGNLADGPGAAANFATVDPDGDLTVTLDADRTLGSLSFADTDPDNTPASWTLAGASILTLAGPSAPTITVDALGAGKTATISAPITAASGFTKAGAGTLLINNAANAPGPITVAAGTLNGGDSGAGLGSAAITLTGAASLGAPSNRNNTWTMANPLVVDAAATGATLNSPNRMRMNGAVTGSGTLNFNVSTTVSRMDLQNDWSGFSGNLNFTGSGGVRLGINGLASNQPHFNAAGWASTNVDLGGSVSLQPNTNSGGNTIQIGALSGSSPTAQLGPHSAGAAATWSVGALGTNTTFAGGIRGSENLTKVGAGTLVLTNTTGIIDTTGTFNVNAGVLQVDGVTTGPGATNVNAGGTLAGNGTLAGAVTVNAGGHIAPGTASSVGTLTLTGGLTLNPGALIDSEFAGAGGNDSLISTSTLTINGGSVNLLNEGAATPFSTNGTYNLIQYSFLAGLGVGGLGVNNPQSGKVYTFGTSGNFITLAISDGAAPVYWNQSTGGAWAAAGNWTGSPPNATGAFAGLGGGGTPIAADATITLDGDKTVGTLSLNNPSFRYTLAQGTGGGSLILDNGSTDAAITDAAGSHTIAAPITLATVGNEVNVVAAPDSLTLSGALTGNGHISKVGAGTLVLAAANPNFTGAFNPAAGTTQITNPNALQSATLNGGDGSIATPLPSLNVGHLGTGTINFSSPTQLSVAADGSSPTFSGSLTGPVTLVKQSNGVFYLAGNNAHTGGVIVNGGALYLAAPQSYTGGTTLNNGAHLELDAGSDLGGDVTVSDGSNILLFATGSSGSPSIFPDFNIILPANATAYVNSSGLGNGLGGSVTGDASTTLVVQNQTSFNALASAANPHQFADMLGTVRVEGTLRFSATTLDNGGDNTTFQVDGTLATRNGGAVSLGALTGTGTLSQGLSSDGASTYTVGLKGASTTFAGTITDAANRQTNLVKAGAGTLTLNGNDARANGSTTTVNAGTLQLAHDNALSTTSPLTVNTGGTLDLNAFNQTSPSLDGTGGTVLLPAATLSLNGTTDTAFAGSVVGAGTLSKDGSAVQTIGSVDLATVTVNAGRLALNSPTSAAASRIQTLNVSSAPLQLDARLVLPNATQADALSLVLTGRNGGTWDGAAGITTTPDLHHGIAITTVSTLGTAAFPDLAGLTGSETLLVGTLYGDLNLDGRLTADDFALIDRGFAKSLTGWTNGDLNYDGQVNAADYYLLDSTYATLNPAALSPALLTDRQARFGDAYVSQLLAAVPEPTSLSLLAFGAFPLLTRRRRPRSR